MNFRCLRGMLFRIIILTVFLVFGGYTIGETEFPPAPTQLQCVIKGKPLKVNLLTLVPINSSSVTYRAHYCHPSSKTRYCREYTNKFYETVCTLNQTTTLFICNMTELVWSLYPNLLDPRLPPKVKGSLICMAVSGTYGNRTRYSRRKCCNVRLDNICSGIQNLQVKPSAKRELTITWETPKDIDDGWNQLLVYDIRYTGNNQTKTIIYTPFTEKTCVHSRQHSTVVKNLAPYTRYSVEVSCYYLSSSGNFDSQVYARTLPEAPYVPPTITGVQTVSFNDTMKSVKLGWRHPPKSKRNGVILKSVVSVRIKSNRSRSPNETAAKETRSVDAFKLNVHGSTSETVINGLDNNHNYLVTVMSCTAECSEESEDYEIKREPNGPSPSAQASTGSTLSTGATVALATVFGLVAIALLVGIGYGCYRHKERRRSKVPPDPLPEPDDVQASDSDITDQLESSDYARPEPLLPSVETNRERAFVLQTEHDRDDNTDKRIPSTEEIPLCENH